MTNKINPISYRVKSLNRLTGYGTGRIKMSPLMKRRQPLDCLKHYHKIRLFTSHERRKNILIRVEFTLVNYTLEIYRSWRR